MFDPEKVERKSGVLGDANTHAGEADAVFVHAEDYDQLLECYRTLQREWNQGIADSQHAAGGLFRH